MWLKRLISCLCPKVNFLSKGNFQKTRQNLGVVESQIETKRFFFLAGIFIILKRCHLQTENLKKLIFANKNQPNHPEIGYKSPSNLVEFLEKAINLKEKFKKIEGELERDEVVEVKLQ